jgi:folate-binding protein YgfZ
MTTIWHQQLDQLGLIQLKGENTATFLQGQLTCDVRELNTGKSSLLGAACDPKGRVLATFRLFQYDNDFYLLLPASMVTLTIEHLKKYAVFSKVSLEDVSQNWSIIGLGADSAENAAELQLNNDLVFIVTEQPYRALLITKKENTKWKDNLDSDEAPSDHWEHCDIESRIVSIIPETRGLFTPQMIDLGKLGGISFKKGCYVGQEIIARTEHLGKLKRHLYLIQIESDIAPNPSEELTASDGKALGVIVKSTKSKVPGGGYLCLAVIQKRALESDTKLSWKTFEIKFKS